MKLFTYNLRHGGHRNLGNHWQFLVNDQGADIVCAQESQHPQGYFTPEEFSRYRGCVHSDVAHGKWGSAVFAKDHAAEPISVSGFEGWVVGAKFSAVRIGGSEQTLRVFSVHAPSPGPYESHVDRLLDAISQHLDDSPLVIAGDFNLTTAVRHPSEEGLRNTPGELRILERLRRDFHLLNAWQLLHPNQNLPQTLRWTNAPAKAYHCDGVFISHSLVSHLVRAEVMQGRKFASLSDHNPVFIELD